MVVVVGVVVTLNLYSDACYGKFSCEAFTCAVVSFNFDTEVAVESVVELWKNCCRCLRCVLCDSLHPSLVDVLYEAVVSVCYKVSNLSACKSEGEELLNLRSLCSILVKNVLNLLVHNLCFLNVLCF